jgi:hypothetical protein
MRRSLLAAALSCAATATAASSSPLCLSALDASLTLCVDASLGTVVSFTPGQSPSTPLVVNASTFLQDSALVPAATTVVQPNGPSTSPVVVTRTYTFTPGPDVPPGAGAVVQETYSSAPTSVHCAVTVDGTTTQPWSVPIATTVAFGLPASQTLKLWAPWDRGSANGWKTSWVDPLQPSDVLPGGWWDGNYRLGSSRGDAGDYIVAPFATVLAADPWGAPSGGDVGLSLHLSPTDFPADIWLFTNGSEEGSFTFRRTHHRIKKDRAGGPVSLDLDYVAHTSDWRDALAWSTRAQAPYWDPVNSDVFACCAGTGSYSSYLGPLNASYELDAMDYAVNWDLSGRFFPWMGMFLPPVLPGQSWPNDAEGSQPRANVTFEIIGAFYREMLAAGYTDLSYFNVNEVGINVVLPPAPGTTRWQRGEALVPTAAAAAAAAAVSSASSTSALLATSLLRASSSSPSYPATCADTWQNASECIITSFLDAVVTAAWDEIGRGVHKGGPYVSWQNAVVVDPGVESYHAFLLEQLARHVLFEDGYTGIIIDRSDWQDLYNLDADDGLSFIPEAAGAASGNVSDGTASSLKGSYARMVQDLRAGVELAAAAVATAAASASPSSPPRLHNMSGDGIMMVNTVGNGRLDQFRYFDGSFSEGSAVNGVGILGARSPAILWTYDASDCCPTNESAGVYFQTHVYLGACPMAPFPGNDHSIPWAPGVASLYARYGPLFQAVANKVWALGAPHLVSVSNSTANGTTYGKVNAFLTVVDVDAEPAALEQALVLPVVRGLDPAGTVILNLTRIDRVFAAGAEHPLVRDRRAVEGLPAWGGITSSSSFVFEVLYPGVGSVWQPLSTSTAPSLLLPVPLQEGCAVVRARVVAARRLGGE